MARFYGTTSGVGRTEATRIGSPSSPVYSTANGWHIGGSAKAYRPTLVDDSDADAITLFLTGGSNGVFKSLEVATFHRANDGSFTCDYLIDRARLRELVPGIRFARKVS